MIGAGLLETPLVFSGQAAAIANQHRRWRRRPPVGSRRREALEQTPADPGAHRRGGLAHDAVRGARTSTSAALLTLPTSAMPRAGERGPFVRCAGIEVGRRLAAGSAGTRTVRPARHSSRRSPCKVPAIDSRTPPSHRREPAPRGPGGLRRPSTSTSAARHPTRSAPHPRAAARRRTTEAPQAWPVEPGGERRCGRRAGRRSARATGRPAAARGREQRRRIGAVVRGTMRRRAPIRASSAARRAGSSRVWCSRLNSEQGGGGPGQAAGAPRARRGRTRPRPCKKRRASEHARNGRLRRRSVRRCCDRVRPSRWQFLRGIPAARGRSGPRCESP